MSRVTPLLPGRYYHIYNRGNNRENIFLEERNYTYFLRLYEKYVLPVCDTYAYCLLRNHFHLLIRVRDVATTRSPQRTPSREPSRGPATQAFQDLFSTYTKAVNKGHARTGKLFQEHFGRIEITSDAYFTNLIFYIHFNPQKHGFVSDFREWRWSSYGAMLATVATKLNRAAVLDWFDGLERLKAFHRGAVDEKSIAALVADDFE